MTRPFTFGFAATILALSGCTPDNPSNECPAWDDNVPPANAPTKPPNEPQNNTPPTRTVDVAACAGGLSQADIDRNLELANTLEKDFGEQRACGLFLRNYSFSLSHWFANAACGKLTRPMGFSYTGSGYYIVGGIMAVQAKLAKDTSFGKKGDDLTFDVFDQGSYGDGPLTITATISAETSWTTNDPLDLSVRIKGMLNIQQEQPKVEGLELWGIPADGKPIEQQQEQLAKKIGESVAFTVDANFVNTASPFGGKVSYRFTAPETTVDSTYSSAPIPYQLVDIVATDEELGQSTSLVHYGVSFIPYPHGPLEGSFIVRVDGGKFPYYIKYSYPNRVEADVLISCTEPAP